MTEIPAHFLWPPPTSATCETCGGCRVAALVWCGGNRWKPEPCPDCSVRPEPEDAGLEAVTDA